MVIAPLHPTMLPLAIAIWSVDAVIWIVLVRLTLSRAPGHRLQFTAWGLASLTDPAHRAVQGVLGRVTGSYCPAWLSWIALIVLLIVAHHTLVCIAVSTQ